MVVVSKKAIGKSMSFLVAKKMKSIIVEFLQQLPKSRFSNIEDNFTLRTPILKYIRQFYIRNPNHSNQFLYFPSLLYLHHKPCPTFYSSPPPSTFRLAWWYTHAYISACGGVFFPSAKRLEVALGVVRDEFFLLQYCQNS